MGGKKKFSSPNSQELRFCPKKFLILQMGRQSCIYSALAVLMSYGYQFVYCYWDLGMVVCTLSYIYVVKIKCCFIIFLSYFNLQLMLHFYRCEFITYINKRKDEIAYAIWIERNPLIFAKQSKN